MENNTILFVDDEEKVLKTAVHLFHNSHYEILTASGGFQGLEVLQEHDPALIVSDIKMPEMDGVEFLKKAALARPDSVRVALSAYTETEDILKLINDGHIHRFIVKPYEMNELHLVVKQCIELYHLRKEKDELLVKLNKKNEELNQVNSQLEDLVKIRTNELQVKDKILHFMLKLEPLEKSLSFILTSFFEVTRQDKIIFLNFGKSDNLELEKAYRKEKDKVSDITEDLKTISNSAVYRKFYTKNIILSTRAPDELKQELAKLNITHFIVNSVRNEHEELGMLIHSFSLSSDITDKIVKTVESFTMYLSMSLSDHAIIGNMDTLYQNIDKILKEI